MRADLIQTGMQMGMTARDAQAYADKLIAIPSTKNTTVKADTSSAQANVKGLQQSLDSTRDKSVTVTANTSSAMSAIRAIGSALAALRDKVVNIIVNKIGGALGFSSGGWVPGGRSNTDSVSTSLAPGEFVVRSGPAAQWAPLLESINAGASFGGAAGGRGGTLAGGGMAGLAGAPVYQVFVSNAVVGTHDELARTVVTALREAVSRGMLPASAVGT
jgi:hypothetical protein